MDFPTVWAFTAVLAGIGAKEHVAHVVRGDVVRVAQDVTRGAVSAPPQLNPCFIFNLPREMLHGGMTVG